MPKNIRVIDDEEAGIDMKVEDSEVIVSGQHQVHQSSPASISTNSPISSQPQQTYVTVIPGNAATRSEEWQHIFSLTIFSYPKSYSTL